MFEYLLAGFLIVLSATFSGLTLGYFSLNVQDLERQAKLGNRQALQILNIRWHGNQLMATLLLANVATNSILSVFMSSLTSGLMAVVVATSLIFIFGELLPQATFHRYGLKLGAALAPIVRIFMLALYPLTFPVVFILNRLFGAKDLPTVYSRRELMEIVSETEKAAPAEVSKEEEKIIHGALQFAHTTVREIMVPKEKAVAFDAGRRNDSELAKVIARHNFMRYPVYSGNPNNIIGILNVKDLLAEDAGTPLSQVKEAFDADFLTVRPSDHLDLVLGRMLKRRKHLAVVQTRKGLYEGLITLENIIEEIIQVEIEEE